MLNEWNTWIGQLVSNYSIDGLRVDSAQQTGVGFFPSFQTAGRCFFYFGARVGEDMNLDWDGNVVHDEVANMR